MQNHVTPMPGDGAPELSFKRIDGSVYDLASATPENLTLILFYRGVHCAICRRQLEELNGMLDAFKDLGVEVVAVSMDSHERAERQEAEWDIGRLNIGYGLTEVQARAWGLFISMREKEGEPEHFAEPGVAIVRPDGKIFALFLQTVPFARPSIKALRDGLQYVLTNDYPIRGRLGPAEPLEAMHVGTRG